MGAGEILRVSGRLSLQGYLREWIGVCVCARTLAIGFASAGASHVGPYTPTRISAHEVHDQFAYRPRRAPTLSLPAPTRRAGSVWAAWM